MSDSLFEDHDLIFLLDGTPLQTHAPSRCAGEFCCVHNPSEHPLKDAPLNWRSDRRLMERVCEHGVGHPDPDALAFQRRILTAEEIEKRRSGDHGCDGCCSGRYEG